MFTPSFESILPFQIPRAFASVTALVAAGCFLSSSSQLSAAEPNTRLQASDLVARLGHQEFAMREQAAARLIELKLDALPALRVGAQSETREIRHRSAKLLTLISEIDLQRRFEEFKASTDPDQDYGLPGWNAYREAVGDSPASRSIFVSMHEEESRLLGLVDGNPKRLRSALANRCDELQSQSIFGRVQTRLGTIATLLFLATRGDDNGTTPLVNMVVYRVCDTSLFETAVDSGPGREVLAILAEAWIARQPLQGITLALHLGLTKGLKGSLPRAREVFEAPVASPSDRIYACLCLAKFGDETDIPRLEAYLEDVNVCAHDQLGGQVVVTQMRDLALASLVKLTKQEPKDFGFDRLVLDRTQVFSLPTLGFRDAPSRLHAIASWREFRRRDVEEKPE